MKKFATILGAGAFVLSTTASADAVFADPGEGGISYEWTVTLGNHGSHELLGSVGGKGSYEPAFENPNIGWTHTTDWVALELEEEVIVEIEYSRQPGFYELKVDRETGEKSYETAGNMLYPSMSIYKGWDNTSEKESGSFNPIGNFWSTIRYKDAVMSRYGETTIIYREKMKAGKYSINLGGVNALYCAEDDECYNGKHGYRAKISVLHGEGMLGMSGM